MRLLATWYEVIRTTIRRLQKNPTTCFAVVITMAMGIGVATGSVNLRGTAQGEPAPARRFNGAWATPGFLRLLRVDPLLGRPFSPTDAVVGADPVVLIGHQVWQQEFEGTADVVGRTVHVNSQPTTIVGVLPKDFLFPISQEIWLPLAFESRGSPRGEGQYLQVIGRLKDGVTLRTSSSPALTGVTPTAMSQFQARHW